MDRLEKNKNIAQTMRETYAKRKSQICKCFKFKIDKSNLSKQQANQLKMMFVEAKWIYNYLLDKDIYSFDYKDLSKITHKDKNRNDIETTISYVSSSVKQAIIQDVINQIKGLSVLKKKGYKVGKLKYKTEYNSINLRQYGNTHSIRGNKFKIQGIKKLIRVRGLDQLSKYCYPLNMKSRNDLNICCGGKYKYYDASRHAEFETVNEAIAYFKKYLKKYRSITID